VRLLVWLQVLCTLIIPIALERSSSKADERRQPV